MSNISYSFTLNVSQGPSVVAAGQLDVEAYELISVVVPENGGKTKVDIQPGAGGQLLIVTADKYGNLTYVVDGAGGSRELDGPHILVGSGAVKLLGATQNQIEFTNNDAQNAANVKIFVGRDATP